MKVLLLHLSDITCQLLRARKISRSQGPQPSCIICWYPEEPLRSSQTGDPVVCVRLTMDPQLFANQKLRFSILHLDPLILK